MNLKDQYGALYKDASNEITSASTTLSAGTEGYGAQGTTTEANVSIDAAYDKYDTPNSVGQLQTTDQTFATQTTGPTTGEQCTLRLKATISSITAAGTYNDTLTLTAVGNF